MHEMALVRGAVDIVLEECEKRGIRRVRRVVMSIGELNDVVEQYVPDLFKYLARETPAAEADVQIRRVPALVRCTECGEIFAVTGPDGCGRVCPRCHAQAKYRLFSGREFRIDGIECDAC